MGKLSNNSHKIHLFSRTICIFLSAKGLNYLKIISFQIPKVQCMQRQRHFTSVIFVDLLVP